MIEFEYLNKFETHRTSGTISFTTTSVARHKSHARFCLLHTIRIQVSIFKHLLEEKTLHPPGCKRNELKKKGGRDFKRPLANSETPSLAFKDDST